MPEWTCSGGSSVTLEGGKIRVSPKGRLGAELEGELAEGAWVSVAPPPGGSVKLSAKPWLVDLWVREAAARRSESVVSDYEPSERDIPPDVLELLGGAEDANADPPDRIY